MTPFVPASVHRSPPTFVFAQGDPFVVTALLEQLRQVYK